MLDKDRSKHGADQKAKGRSQGVVISSEESKQLVHRFYTEVVGTAPRWWRRWPEWVGYAAATWSLIYGALGLYWALGGAGFPFGSENDSQHALSVLGGVRSVTGAPVIAVLGLVGAAVAVLMARARGRRIPRAALLGFAWIAAVALALVIPDFRVLVAVAYTPLVLIGAPFDLPPGPASSTSSPGQ